MTDIAVNTGSTIRMPTAAEMAEAMRGSEQPIQPAKTLPAKQNPVLTPQQNPNIAKVDPRLSLHPEKQLKTQPQVADMFISDLTPIPPEPTQAQAQSIPTPQAAQTRQSPKLTPQHTSLMMKILFIVFSLLSGVEVVLAFRRLIYVLMVEFPFIESIIGTDQLTEQLFFQLALKVSFLFTAALLGVLAAFLPWISHQPKPSFNTVLQTSLFLLVLLLLFYTNSFQYFSSIS